MLTIKTITEQRDEVIRRLAVKHFDATESTESLHSIRPDAPPRPPSTPTSPR